MRHLLQRSEFSRFRRRPQGPLIYAHRGAHGEGAPENSLAAFERAIELGIEGVELDVRITADSKLVVFHDADLKRLTGQDQEIGSLSQRRILDIKVDGHAIPTLDDALDLLCGAGYFVNIEIKAEPKRKVEAARCVAQLIRRRAVAERGLLMMSTFIPRVMLAFQVFCPTVPAAFLFDEPNTGLWRAAMVNRIVRPRGLHPERTTVTRQRIAFWRRIGFVNAWTVDEIDDMRRLDRLGIDGIITNRPDVARTVLRTG